MTINIIGQTFGRWLVLEATAKRSRNGTLYYLCKCICGNTKEVNRLYLTNGESTSCGCVHKYRDGLGNARNMFNHYIRNAANRSITFDLTFDAWYNLTQQNCYYCGVAPSSYHAPNGYKTRWCYNGVDRRNSDLAYTSDNCVPCCKQCNYAKRDLTEQEYLAHCLRIVKHHGLI